LRSIGIKRNFYPFIPANGFNQNALSGGSTKNDSKNIRAFIFSGPSFLSGSHRWKRPGRCGIDL